MSATISINPYATTVAKGMFNNTAQGMRQGTAFPDPATRNAQRTTQLASTETLPMWGGVGVYENIPGVPNGPNASLGPIVGRADSLAGAKALAGFSVFDGAYGMVTTPESPVPLIGSGGQVMTYALGSRARIVVAMDPYLINLQGDPIGSQVSWDFYAQRLIPYLGTLTISSGTYDNATGLIVLTLSAPALFGPGDEGVLSSLTGTGAFASLNGNWDITVVDGSDVTLQGPVGAGASTITGGSMVLGSGASSLLPVKVLDVQDDNCMVVEYDEDTGLATYNFNGACALIQI